MLGKRQSLKFKIKIDKIKKGTGQARPFKDVVKTRMLNPKQIKAHGNASIKDHDCVPKLKVNLCTDDVNVPFKH